MDEQVDRLVAKVLKLYRDTPSDQRFVIAVSGVPGSGKTTLSVNVTKRLNSAYRAQHADPSADRPDIAAYIPMDGYHLTRKQLDAMPDPAKAHERRGAAFTFDAPGFLSLVKRLRENVNYTSPPILAPSFDHGIKDPVQDDIAIEPSTRIVVCEGNYLSYGAGAPEWRQAAALMDELWFVDVAEDLARKRLIRRHMQGGRTEQEATDRAGGSDATNARDIIQYRLPAHEVITSVEDEHWRHA